MIRRSAHRQGSPSAPNAPVNDNASHNALPQLRVVPTDVDPAYAVYSADIIELLIDHHVASFGGVLAPYVDVRCIDDLGEEPSESGYCLANAILYASWHEDYDIAGWQVIVGYATPTEQASRWRMPGSSTPSVKRGTSPGVTRRASAPSGYRWCPDELPRMERSDRRITPAMERVATATTGRFCAFTKSAGSTSQMPFRPPAMGSVSTLVAAMFGARTGALGGNRRRPVPTARSAVADEHHIVQITIGEHGHNIIDVALECDGR